MTATALALLCATTGMAQEPKLKAATMRYVFEQWAQDHNITQASFIALYQGKAIGEPLNADFPIELASLSKAITAICAAQIIEEGMWSVQTTSADVLGTGPEGITVGELITHTAGIGPDGTQGIRWLWRDTNVPLSVEVANAALDRDPDQSGAYAYNNENYAILGQMISVALNAPYAEACTARALTAAGVTTAEPSSVMGGTLPWGGWSMSARDYAHFQYYWFGPQGAYSAGSPPALRVDFANGAAYGLGMFERNVANHRNFWHFGAWCMPLRLNTGAFAVIWQGEWSVVATYDACIDEGAMIALDAALSKVVYGR
ncbi:MAG: serine hydrolase domain-containing protein [Sulfitobacter sp.]